MQLPWSSSVLQAYHRLSMGTALLSDIYGAWIEGGTPVNYLNTFIKAKNLDKQMVLDYLQGQDPRKVYPLYHAPLIPTFAGAIDIFELKQLEKIKVETQQSQGGLYVAIVQLYDKRNDLSRAGASQDRDEVVAEWLAFSNAVRQITF